MNAIEIINLKKSYKSKQTTPNSSYFRKGTVHANKEVLHGINLSIKQGEFVGVLGSNGAGKTTTINCIAGISEPTEGKILVNGHDVVQDYKQARGEIGLCPQEFTVDIFQTPYEILYYQAGFFGIIGEDRKQRVENLLNVFELMPHKDKKFQFLSGGLKRRVIVAKSLIHEPSVIILDEPTAGVDVETRQALWKYVKTLHEKGKTILLTSHYLEEVEEMCDRVIIIKDGNVVEDLNMKDITKTGKLQDFYLKTVENKK
jgi:ABC-2 type transport system ATP-binding protein